MTLNTVTGQVVAIPICGWGQCDRTKYLAKRWQASTHPTKLHQGQHTECCKSQVPAASPHFRLWHVMAQANHRSSNLPPTQLLQSKQQLWRWGRCGFESLGHREQDPRFWLPELPALQPPPATSYGKAMFKKKQHTKHLNNWSYQCVYSTLPRCPSFLSPQSFDAQPQQLQIKHLTSYSRRKMRNTSDTFGAGQTLCYAAWKTCIDCAWETGVQGQTQWRCFKVFLQYSQVLQFYFGKRVCFAGYVSRWILLKLEQNETSI